MNNARGFTYGLVLGAGLMFLYDPRRGAARRATLAQKAQRAMHDLEGGAGIGARDFEHRAVGLAARVFGDRPSKDVSDDVVVARVRAKLGRVCSHPHAVHVAASDGVIELSGPILRTDLELVLSELSKVPGVRAIDDELDVREDPADLPSLQGPPHRRRRLPKIGTPAARFALGAGAIGVCFVALVKGQPIPLVLGATSAFFLARSIVHRGRLLPVEGPRMMQAGPMQHLPEHLPDPFPEESGWVPGL